MENTQIQIKSLRDFPMEWEAFSSYIASRWTDEEGKALYDDCIFHARNAEYFLPNWFIAVKDNEVVGCAGLITNDFISRMDLMPWLCALYVDEMHRKRGIAGKLISAVKEYAKKNGMKYIYLATDHTAFYERYGGEMIATGVHPWRETSRIYRMETGYEY